MSLHFIQRRQFENYLLDSEAISCIINQLEGFSESPICPNDVESWINENGKSAKYIKNYRKSNPLDDEYWQKNVDAAKLLSDMFSDLSEHRVEFRKTVHSVRIFQWIIDNRIENLEEIKQVIIESLSDLPTPATP